MLVHFTSNIVSCWSVVARIQFGKPFAILIFCYATSHFFGVRPDHGGVVPYIGAKPEWFDTFFAEQRYFIVPISNGSSPIGCGTFATLLVDVKILSHDESGYFSAFGAVVSEYALISVTLGDPRKFFIPFHLLHVCCGRLWAWFSAFFETISDLCSQLVMYLYDLLLFSIGNSTAQNSSTLWPIAFICPTHGVLFCDSTIVKFSLCKSHC